MPRKNILVPYKIIDAGDMSLASVTSEVTEIQYMDDISMQMVWTGAATGTFAVEGSLSYEVDYMGNVVNAGTWTALTLSPAPVASGASGSWLIDMAGLSFPYIRLVYTKIGGTGSLDAFISGKEI